jgi:hypothetical protein
MALYSPAALNISPVRLAIPCYPHLTCILRYTRCLALGAHVVFTSARATFSLYFYRLLHLIVIIETPAQVEFEKIFSQSTVSFQYARLNIISYPLVHPFRKL